MIVILVACLNAKLVKHIGSDPEKNLEANLDLQKSETSYLCWFDDVQADSQPTNL